MEIKIKSLYSKEILKSSGRYSFLNFASISKVLDEINDRDITYFCDGFLLCWFMSLLLKNKISRVSFDYTSIANEVFIWAQENNASIVFVGANTQEANQFLKGISIKYPRLNAVSFSGFYTDAELEDIKLKISEISCKIIVAGLGAGKQEQFISDMALLYPNKCYFTCGGFIRQQSNGKDYYYPALVNKLGLRAFFRMYKEPHTIKRYFLDYPKNIIKLLFFVYSGKVMVRYIK